MQGEVEVAEPPQANAETCTEGATTAPTFVQGPKFSDRRLRVGLQLSRLQTQSLLARMWLAVDYVAVTRKRHPRRGRS